MTVNATRERNTRKGRNGVSQPQSGRGFTLIELSIVLVIIGLNIGGVLTGQTLISAIGVRAPISQLERYNTAANTFQGKYGYLPGDVPAAPAVQFGFIGRGTAPGEGDGNGILDGNDGAAACGDCAATGELLSFWVDLSYAKMMDGGFNSGSEQNGTGLSTVTGIGIAQFLPPAKIGSGNYIYIWSGGPATGFHDTGSDSQNYFALGAVSQLYYEYVNAAAGLTVQQAYSIDNKIDDGLPQSGRVFAMYLNFNINQFKPVWSGTAGQTGAAYTTATTGSATTCFDNGGVVGTQHYSLTQNGGAGVNCALSFKMQAGD